MAVKYSGTVIGNIFDLRFATSGKVASVLKKIGEKTAAGDLIARLDKKIWQTELDQQLAEYEQTRAEFERFNLKQTSESSQMWEYAKKINQASLNVSVKQVELAKAKLDQTDLTAPFAGILTNIELVPGIYVTPASNSVKLLDLSSISFLLSVPQEDLSRFKKPVECQVNIRGLDTKISGDTQALNLDCKLKNDDFGVVVKLSSTEGLILGKTGQAVIV
jgi:membrane fusion protein, multidrug efflux system